MEVITELLAIIPEKSCRLVKIQKSQNDTEVFGMIPRGCMTEDGWNYVMKKAADEKSAERGEKIG